MGVKNLFETINKYAFFTKNIEIFELKNKKIAIDVSIYRRRNNYTQFLLELVRRLLSVGSVPIIIFDICSPLIKKNTQLKRIKLIEDRKADIENTKELIQHNIDLLIKSNDEKEILEFKELNIKANEELAEKEKNMFEVKQDDFDYLWNMFDMMGVLCFGIPYHESEGLCSWLNKKGYVDYVMTEDQDVIPYGAIKWLRGYDRRTYTIQLCELDKVYEVLNHEKILLLALCLGNDYVPRLFPPGKMMSFIGDPDYLWKKVKEEIPIYKDIVSEYDYDYTPDIPSELATITSSEMYDKIMTETKENKKKIQELIYKYVPGDAESALKILDKIIVF